MRKFGLIGRNISYSFSRSYFRKKFDESGTDAVYINFDLQEIGEFKRTLEENPELKGVNVTIPYKEQILPFLQEIDPVAAEIGAVNTVKIHPSGALQGFNTDHYGFSEAIRPMLRPFHKKALVLGTGGASKAVIYALKSLDLKAVPVSRSPLTGEYSYKQLDRDILQDHFVIVNCTPLGTSPEISAFPPVPIEFISEHHLVFDLIYNPGITRLMQLSLEKGAQVSNGLRMLELQAEKAWKIWNS